MGEDGRHEDGRQLAARIGERVRRERLRRHWTLDQLATLAGVSRRTLVKVEQGAANPSVGTVLGISDALGVGLATLVEQDPPAPVQVTRHGEGATLWRSEAGGRGVLLSATDPPHVVELWDWSLAPGDRHASEPHAPGTEEMLQVVRGTVTVEVAGGSTTLGPGDAVAFPGDTAHAYANPKGRPARFCLTVYQPGVGAVPLPGRGPAPTPGNRSPRHPGGAHA